MIASPHLAPQEAQVTHDARVVNVIFAAQRRTYYVCRHKGLPALL